uniref:Uncharacterized protein n=1 Tax=Vitrella brassicaformis TaxID=1169539 RepID=A0A7S1JSS6_9ALVE|mmetsp:Transcript_23239/g.57492  ORF Transcript_23239/g.57492 Transcript_23239/m.57492 type:complete len:114 (+) Transcript_23239:133-474(+)
MGSIIPVVKIPVPHPPLPEEQWPSGPSILAVNDAYERYTPDLALAPSFAHYWMVVEYVNLDGTVDADDLPKFREAMLKVQEMEKEVRCVPQPGDHLTDPSAVICLSVSNWSCL